MKDLLSFTFNLLKVPFILLRDIFFHGKPYWKVFLLIILILSLFGFIKGFSFESPENYKILSNNLLQFSGIFSALLITFIFSKVFKIREENLVLDSEIKLLGQKLTAFRKICFYLNLNRNLWKNRIQFDRFKKEFPNLSLADIQNGEWKEYDSEKFYNGDYSNESTIKILLALETLLRKDKFSSKHFAWISDPNYSPIYTIEELDNYYYPSNQLWYYFDHQYSVTGKYLFEFSRLSKNDIEKIVQSANQIISIDEIEKDLRLIITASSSEIHDKYLPRLFEATNKKNNSLPSSLRQTLRILITLLIFGVLIPLLTQSLNIEPELMVLIVQLCTTICIIFILGLLMILNELIKTEIQT